MDLRYSVCTILQPIEPRKLFAVVEFLKKIVSTHEPGKSETLLQMLNGADTLLRKVLIKGSHNEEKNINVYTQLISKACSTIKMATLFGPYDGGEQVQSTIMVLLLLQTKMSTGDSKTKYSCLHDKFSAATAQYLPSEFLDAWTHRLGLIKRFEEVYWKADRYPIHSSIQSEGTAQPHHVLSLAVVQLALWPDSFEGLKNKSPLKKEHASLLFYHLETHRTRLRWNADFEQSITRILRAWAGNQKMVNRSRLSAFANNMLTEGIRCEDAALTRWMNNPRSLRPSSFGESHDKPLPSVNAATVQRQKTNPSVKKPPAKKKVSTNALDDEERKLLREEMEYRREQIKARISAESERSSQSSSRLFSTKPKPKERTESFFGFLFRSLSGRSSSSKTRPTISRPRPASMAPLPKATQSVPTAPPSAPLPASGRSASISKQPVPSAQPTVPPLRRQATDPVPISQLSDEQRRAAVARARFGPQAIKKRKSKARLRPTVKKPSLSGTR